MFKKVVVYTCMFGVLAGCAGRTANPVMVHQTNDLGKSCPVLQSELINIENNIQRLVPETKKGGKNIALGVAGLVAWPAWLFMDLSSAEKEEINAYKQRHDYLSSIAREKQCDFGIGQA